MEKAYDLKALGLKFKEQGLPIMEDALEASAGKAYIAFKEWIQESALLSENKVDDIFAPFVAQLDVVVLPAIAAIDLDGDGK